jgi:hypothetical protein
LIDFENVHVKSLARLKEEHFRIKVFLGPKNTALPRDLVLAMQAHGDRAEYIVLDTPGKNALDFHLVYYLGTLVAGDPEGYFHIISKDTGFDPLIQHLRSRKVSIARSESVDEMPCFKVLVTNGMAANGSSAKGGVVNGGKASLLDEMVKLALTDLIRRKASKPRTEKTLRSTIHATCGKELSVADVSAICAALVKLGFVKVDGEKVSYALPAN